ncbi:sugar ABC transporter ATP-binding protein [Lacrimispora sp.]|uniref:sugar ABC transporter ATP-binding protein n=1 Tax=Lacrimispora sp. TaxID=2719234 RepID=UPI00289B7D30|nr:sugar ABC transporter ATP-binding protein [Lacrimispora sp.]
MEEQEIVLEMKEISKSFPGVKALDQVSLKIKAGTVHALMGENGAGKSTLMKCAFGIYHPDEGEIFINGEKVYFADTKNAMDHGISMIHQELHPIRVRNVMENIWVGRIPYKKIGGIKWVDYKTMYDQTAGLFDHLGIAVNPREMVSNLSVSHCQLLEIARAVSYGAKVIIMDEPTSSLTDGESELLFRIIRQLTAQKVAIIYISHKIEEVLTISDEVTIMRDGKLVGSWASNEMNMDLIVNRMVGREMTNRFPPKNHKPERVMLEAKNLTSQNPHSFKNISFQIKKGEILGIGGLVGAQRTELMEAIFGLRKTAGGQIFINGTEVSIHSPSEAIKHKMALLTEERRSTGIFPMLSVEENIVMANQSAHKKEYTGGRLFLSRKKRTLDAKKYVDSFSIKTPGLKTQIQYLSGGNQQKALLGRWMLINPDLLILDEPTRGIDVGAKYEIYSLMEQMASEGKSVIMISSEMPELMGMSDRIMVMCEGRVSGIIEGDEVTEERIMHLASAVEKTESSDKREV